MNAVRRWGYAKQHPQRMVQYFSNSITNKQQASKIWSLYSFEGFLLYIRDIVKITKVTNINYSAVFEKRHTSAHGGCISGPCRLRSTQRPPGRSMGAVDSGNAPGLNSRPSACGRSARGRREAAFGGTAWGSRCGARGTATNPARPVAPAVPRAPWASPPAIPVAGWA